MNDDRTLRSEEFDGRLIGLSLAETEFQQNGKRVATPQSKSSEDPPPITTGAGRPTVSSSPRCPNSAWKECRLRQAVGLFG